MGTLLIASAILLFLAIAGVTYFVSSVRTAISRDRKLEALEAERDRLATWIHHTRALAGTYYAGGKIEMGEYILSLADAKQPELDEANRKIDRYIAEQVEREALEK